MSSDRIRTRARAGKFEDEIVISGISGKFPSSNNMHEFAHNLFNKIDMVDDDERRWRHTNPEIPKRMGKLKELAKFDATFFGIHFKQAHTMDPQSRILIERAYEAVLDAGVNPKSIRGSRTGVFVGACFAESEKTWFYEKIVKDGFGITGCSRAMLANRISYTMGLTGPSFLVDTACSSSMFAIDCAFNALRNGECDAAIVGGTNLLLHPYVTLQFSRLGVLAANGYCRPFDAGACGYVRAEGICAIYLQRRQDAKRIYANMVYSKTNCDGYKEEGITYPSGKVQKKLLKEFYEDINVDPSTINYIEAHATGTTVGDPEECLALDEIYCKNRTKPLLIGSVKSNMGHSESTSGLCSVAKVLLAFEHKKIPPNINFEKIRPDIPALIEGKLKVVTEPTDLEGSLISINSFGFGGANAHLLLRGHEKEKVNNGAPTDSLPRLIIWCGRTENAVNSILDDMLKRPLDVEFVGLLHSTQMASVPANIYRGFGVYAHQPGENATCISREVKHYSGIKRPVVWVFSGMGSQWTTMGRELLNIPLFKKSIDKSCQVMAKKGLNLMEILTSEDPKMFDNILNSFVGIAAIQIGIVDILKELGMEPDYIIGHSVGELGCAYADGCFTAEQMILSAYSRGMASIETKTVFGSMAAIGLGYKNIRTMLPSGIEVACHNGPDSCTISGPAENVAAFVSQLKNQGIFAKEVPCSNIPYHSSYIAEMGPKLLMRLNEVVKKPIKRSTKWLSSSIAKIKWDQVESQYSSAYYHTNNLLSPVLFEETSAMLPKECITIEIAPHGLLQAILKKSMPSGVHIGLTQRGNKANDHFFIAALGKVFSEGVDMNIEKLYPPIQYPVSRGTAMVSPLIEWDHSEDWFVTKFDMFKKNMSGERKVNVTLSDQDYEFIVGHTIDGRILFPATAYLFLAWETLAMTKGVLYFDIDVEFEDIKFLRATTFTKDTDIEFTIMVQPGTGRFEISESTTPLVTGFIKIIENQTLSDFEVKEDSGYPTLTTKDFYKELRLRGYHYNGAFRSVVEARGDGMLGKVKWDLNWVAFLDCLLQIQILGKDTRSLILPTGIQKLVINTKEHLAVTSSFEDPENIVMDVKVSEELNILRSGGVEVTGLQANVVGRRRPPGIPVLEKYEFVPNIGETKYLVSDGLRICVQIALENNPTIKIKAVEVDNKTKTPIISHIYDALADLPLVTPDLMLLTPQNIELDSIHVEDGKLSTQTNCLFVIASEVTDDNDFLEKSSASLADNGFLISREKPEFSHSDLKLPQGYHLISILNVEEEKLVLLQHFKRKFMGNPTIIDVSEKDIEFAWLEKTKAAIKNGPTIIVSQGEQFSGIVGLVNCLRKEPDGYLFSAVFVQDKDAPLFDIQNDFYKPQLKLGLAINVFKSGKWGTYRHLQLRQNIECKPSNKHCYVNALIKSDLSSLKWINGSYNYSIPAGELVKIQYASLNFRDVMLATGKLSADVIAENRLEHECVLGFEFSGITQSGKRVMGMTISAAMATHIEMDEIFTFECPDSWTLADAATVPAVYGTVYSAFFISAKIQKGKSILIHAGSGGVGLAAIRVALAYGLEVFTTVSTSEKKQYLLSEFPKLKEENIGNSRNTSFEKLIKVQTKGKGVDYVLNSLAEEKLQASIRCLGKGGKFLEIGKFDMANDTKIGMGHFLKELSFHSIMVDKLFKAPKEEKMVMRKLIERDVKSGIIKPLKTNVFPASEVEQAFRFLASGKHMGKVLLQIRENEQDEFTSPISVIPRVYCSPQMAYVVPGGLGGFGMELADWLIMRGCRKLVLSSSRGISKQYQAYRIKIWETYGVQVVVNTDNISTKEGCENLLKEAKKLGPIGGIFNLAVALRDSILENQDPTKYVECMAPKAVATKYLDEVSRRLCPHLQHFVVFSSVSCGRGNAGQSNYGMANSVMERIIEQRHADGLPAKAIQWGAVGEVGLVADMQEDKLDMEIGGTLQQRISSCLEEMDPLLYSDDPIVSSMVVAEKRSRGGAKGDIIETVMHIMNLRDIKSVSMDTTLSELGMDSLMAVEIKQTLEREFELFLSPQDLRSLTFAKLKEFSIAREAASDEKVKLKLANENIPTGVTMLLRNLGDESNSKEKILRLKSFDNSDSFRSCALIVPGIECVAGNTWYQMAETINLPTFILQVGVEKTKATCIKDLTDDLLEGIARLYHKKECFYLIGYSFGALITLEIARYLEKMGLTGHVVLVDGAPKFLKRLTVEQKLTDFSEESVQNLLLIGICQIMFPDDNVEIIKHLALIPTWDEKVAKLVDFGKDQNIYTPEYVRKMLDSLVNRVKMILTEDLENIEPLEYTPITLIRPSEVSIADIDEEYGLANHTKESVNLKFVEGNHITMLQNPKLIQMINEMDPLLKDRISFENYTKRDENAP